MKQHEIIDVINKSWKRMSIRQRRLWEVVRIDPIKWELNPEGKEGNGFWVVAICGNRAIWYNDIEEGFDTSTWSSPGTLNEYGANQEKLEWVVGHFLSEIEVNNPTGKMNT